MQENLSKYVIVFIKKIVVDVGEFSKYSIDSFISNLSTGEPSNAGNSLQLLCVSK